MHGVIKFARNGSKQYLYSRCIFEKHSRMDEYMITPGGVGDIGTLAAFQVEMAMESEGAVLSLERVQRGVRAVVEDPAKGLYMVARSAGVPVGCLMVTREWSDWNCVWYWWVQSVYVVPGHRGKGVYRAMYSKVKEMALEQGVTWVRLYVDKKNTRAQKVYESVGMAECHYIMYEEELA